MGVTDAFQSKPEVAYIFEDYGDFSRNTSYFTGSIRSRAENHNLFIFQYWPSQVTDSYKTNYQQKDIPGGSHPLYQWVSGGPRTISFEAVFTCEIDDPLVGTNLSVLTPSHRYTVDVAGAIARLRSYQYPTYPTGAQSGKITPPPKLRLVLPGTQLGNQTNVNDILCILMDCRVTYESWFPTGKIRTASVQLEFHEIVQHTTDSSNSDAPNIKFISASSFDLAKSYKYSG